MKRFRLIGLVLVAAFSLAAMLSASAVAVLPQFLPRVAPNNVFSGTATGSSTLENSAGTKIECTKANTHGGSETDTLGTFHVTFENCSASGVKCTTEGDSTGLILTEGSFHFVYDTLGTGETLGVAVLFLGQETDFSCLGGLLNNKIKGTMLCLIHTPLTSSKRHTLKCEGEAKGKAKEKTYWNDNGTIVEAQLLSNLNEGGFKESNLQAESTMATVEAGAWMNE
jgi:hypothetical protein